MSLNNKIGIKLTQMYMISPIDMDNNRADIFLIPGERK
jgi:hypothetical protein